MGRLLRPVADGLVYHALNRGNNRDRVFGDEGDFRAFLRALAQTQLRYPFALFGCALMSNYFHLLVRAEAGQSISRILQSLTVAHTCRYHRRVSYFLSFPLDRTCSEETKAPGTFSSTLPLS